MASVNTKNTVLELSIPATKEKDIGNNSNTNKLKEEEHTNHRDDKSNNDATETMAGADNNTDHEKGDKWKKMRMTTWQGHQLQIRKMFAIRMTTMRLTMTTY